MIVNYHRSIEINRIRIISDLKGEYRDLLSDEYSLNDCKTESINKKISDQNFIEELILREASRP